MQSKLVKSLLYLGVVLIMLPQSVFAGETKVLGGVIASTQSIPMFGMTGMVGYQTDIFGSWKQETTLYLHQMEGTKSLSKSGSSGDVTVEFKAMELDYFILIPDFLGFTAVGPGVGYGIAETVETQTGAVDLSPFFTAKDIHYGVLLLKFEMNLSAFDCETTFNSFGGLIAGEFLCGIKF